MGAIALAGVAILALLLTGIVPSPLALNASKPVTLDPDVSFSQARAASGPETTSTAGGPWYLVAAIALVLHTPTAEWASNNSGSDPCGGPTGTIYYPATHSAVSSGLSAVWVIIYSNFDGKDLEVLVTNGTVDQIIVTLTGTVASGSGGSIDCGSTGFAGMNGTLVDSPTAVAAYDANGGSAFLASHPNSEAELILVNEPSGTVGLDGITGPIWGVEYSSCDLFGDSGCPTSSLCGTVLGVVNAQSGAFVTQLNESAGECGEETGISSVTATVDTGPGVTPPSLAVSDPGYPGCPDSSDTACFTANTDGSCSYAVNAPSGGDAMVVLVDNGAGDPLPGATVTLTGSAVTVVASPSATQTTGANGEALFTSLTGTVPANDEAGGSITITATYASGGTSSTVSTEVSVEPPTVNTTSGDPVSC